MLSVFFFFKQKTAYEMRISDWSSDVCPSDLEFDGRTACCDGASRWPDLVVEPAAPDAPTQGPAQPFAAFFPQCGGCHATGETSPPNFLAGSGAQVAARLRHCAPRLYVRLAMWHRDPQHREKTQIGRAQVGTPDTKEHI